MPRMKKVVKYIPNTKLPDSREAYERMWVNRQEYTLSSLLDLCDIADKHRNTGMRYTNESSREYYKGKFDTYTVNDSNWQDVRTDGARQPYIRSLLQHVYPISKEFNELNNTFLEEYNSREDLQEFYQLHAKNVNWIYDRYGNHYARRGHYTEMGEKDKEFWDALDKAPADYFLFQTVANNTDARIFLEKTRETPFIAGDLVKLRAVYIGHPDHDPLWLSRYEQSKTGKTIPDKTVDRVGMVMKVTQDVPWRATKGSKQIEVLWLGATTTVMVPEKIVKFETRPTLKNGLKQRE